MPDSLSMPLLSDIEASESINHRAQGRINLSVARLLKYFKRLQSLEQRQGSDGSSTSLSCAHDIENVKPNKNLWQPSNN